MITAIIELTENCNLGCTFCLRPSFKKQTMGLEVLEKVIKEFLRAEKERVDFTWHGGEPLILGVDFYKKIVEFQKKHNRHKTFIKNLVQTNATLLSEEFIEFFEKNNFFVGTSIQGTKEIHDKTRIDLGGKGTFDRVIEKINKLSSKASGICVLTKDTLGKEKEIYETLKKHTRGGRTSEYFPGGLIPNKGEIKDPVMPTSKEYGESMIRFYGVWKNDENPLDLRPITDIIHAFIRGKCGSCTYSQESCNFGIIGIKQNGDFYTCLRGAENPNFFMGNAKDKPLSKLNEFAKRDGDKRLKGLKKEGCVDCQFWNQCNGGCPQESLRIWEDYEHKSYYCEGRQLLFKHIKKDLDKLENEETRIFSDK